MEISYRCTSMLDPNAWDLKTHVAPVVAGDIPRSPLGVGRIVVVLVGNTIVGLRSRLARSR